MFPPHGLMIRCSRRHCKGPRVFHYPRSTNNMRLLGGLTGGLRPYAVIGARSIGSNFDCHMALAWSRMRGRKIPLIGRVCKMPRDSKDRVRIWPQILRWLSSKTPRELLNVAFGTEICDDARRIRSDQSTVTEIRGTNFGLEAASDAVQWRTGGVLS
jgi:hypothetical protein